MPKTLNLSIGATSKGVSVARRATINADKDGGVSKNLPAAKTGELTTRTDNDTGTLTMDPGHGIGTGNKLDIYWVDPTTGAEMSRVNITVGTVAGDSVPIDAGNGDNLPLVNTDIRAMVPVVETVDAPLGAAAVNLQGIVAYGGASCTVHFFEGATLITSVRILASGVNGAPDGYIWANGHTGSNPLATAAAVINTVSVSHGNALGAKDVVMDYLYN